MNRTMRTLALLAAVLLPAIGYVSYKPDDPLRKVDLALGDRAYSDAVALLETEAAKSPRNEDVLLLKLATAHELNRDFDKAIAALDRLLEKFPKSEWARKARFRKAQVLAAQKQWDKAQAVAGREIRYLVSNDRKMELAETYLNYAQKALKPADPDKKPDYEKARVFFEKALDLGITGEKAEEVRFRIGLCHIELGQLDQAIARLDTFAKDHPRSKWAATALGHLALARQRKGEAVRARVHYRDLIADYADTPEAATAHYQIAETYGIPNPANDESLELGVKALREFVAKYPDHARALQADFQIGQCYQNRGRADQAIAEYRRFIEARAKTTDDLLPTAKIQLGHVLRGQRRFDEATETWSAYLKAHPTHKEWDNVQREIINTRFMIAEDFYRLKKYDDARKALEEFLVQYPLDSRASQAAYLLGEIESRLGRPEKAIAQWEKVVSKYAGQDYAKRARCQIALTYETVLNDMTKAHETYKKSAEEDHWADGIRRFEELKRKSLVVVTERVLRTDEKPVIRVSARNIEKLKLSAYRINMESYFRRHYRFGGVENLDIALIEPDKRWEYSFPRWEKYRLYETEIAVPLDGPGVWAINVSDDEFEATTMFAVSDLAVITKATRKEVLAFAQNTRTKKPYPNTPVLVSDGTKILVSGKTNEKGVFQQKVAELKDAREARFFAYDGAHCASNDLNVAQLAYVPEIQPRAYVFTDKPAYIPGQMVHVAGIVRTVRDGQYEFKKGDQWACDLVSARGDLVERRNVALDDFGMYHADFVLAAQAPLGNYTIRLYKEKGPSFASTFRVERYQLESIELKVDLPQTIFLRGEKVKGKMLARYYYGEPVKDHRLVYEIAGFFIREARTNEKGEVEFEFDTREFVESQMLTVQARLPEDNVATARNLWISTRALNLAVSTTRNVYLAGEKFDVTVKATDLLGEKTTATVALHVVKMETVDGRATEKEVSRHELRFGKEKGEGAVAVQAADGGSYVIRAEANDRFGTPVTAQKPLFISGDKDTVMLRVLADRETFKVGEMATVDVVCRTTETVLGLLTHESDGIIGYEIKELKKGQNAHEFRMLDSYAPNVVLAVAAIHGNKFFAAEKDFTVNKGLTIEIKPERETYEPGQTAKVLVRAFDQEGKPARAQVVLALVDQAIFALYGETLPDIRGFFYGARRARSVRTDTSATFRHAPPTKPVAKALREEQAREDEAIATAERMRTLAAPPAAELPAAAGVATMGRTLGLALEQRRALGEEDLSRLQAIHPGVQMMAGVRGKIEGAVDQAAVAYERPDAEAISQLPDILVMGSAKMPRSRAGGAYGGGRPMSSRGPVAGQPAGLEAGEAGGRFQRVTEDLDISGNIDLFFAHVSNGPAGEWFVARRDKDARAEAVARRLFLELAYWNPSVRTDEKGEANVSIPLPDNMTTWKLRARGTTARTVVGDGSGSFVAKRDFFIDLKLPRIATENNTIQMGVSVHNLTDVDREVSLNVHSAVEERGQKSEVRGQRTDVRELLVKAHETQTVWVERKIEAGERLRIEASAAGEVRSQKSEVRNQNPEVKSPKSKVQSPKSEVRRDTVVRSVPIRPWGIAVRDSRGGRAHDSVAVTLALPTGRTYTNRTMEIVVGPVIEHTLFDIPPMGLRGDNTTLASRALSTAALVEYLTRTGERGTVRYRTLMAELQQLAGQLASSRRDDGVWNFASRRSDRGEADPHVSALALRALARAKALGAPMAGETLSTATAGILNAYQKLAEADNARKADLLYALSFVGKADFTYANRLYRLRNALDSRSLALLTVTLVQLDRAPMAKEVADVLVAKGVRATPLAAPATIYWRADERGFAWSLDPLETTALAVFALERVGGFGEQVEAGVAWLLQYRARGAGVTLHSYVPPFSPKGVAAMTEALAEYYGKAKPATNDYALEVLVNDKPLRKIAVSGSTRTVTLDVPAALITEGATRVDLKFAGRGEYAYSCVLGGFTRDLRGLETREPGARQPTYRVERYYEPANLIYDGKVVPRGFSVARDYQFFRNAVAELPAGQCTHVTVQFHPNRYPPDKRYFILTGPIPEGCTVLPDSVTGEFLHYEIGDGEIVFYVGERDQFATISYKLLGQIPGAYQTLPSQLRNAYDPSEIFLSEKYDLKVLQASAKSSDEYKLSPDEYYHLGLGAFEKKDYGRANELLEALVAKWQLQAQPYEKVVETLLAANIERYDPNRIVKYFEIIYEQFPKKVLMFEQMLRVATAYVELREFERAYQVYRGMAESSFLKEANIAGDLRKQGEFLAAVDFLHNLCHTYPDLEVVQQSLYSLSQLVYSTANKMGEVAELREKKITREDLLWRAISLLDEFMAGYPENPTVAEAAFSMANAYLDLEASNDVVALCQRFQKRYPKSPFLSGYQYVEAYGHFINGRYDQALALCKKVATEKYPTAQGALDYSENRDLAIYIMGQIYHAQARPVEAIAEYDRVKDKFADAREAIAYFKEKRLELPEVTTYRTADKPLLTATYRNVKQLDLRAYRVDLMKLYLMRRNLNNIADVDLAGIEPYTSKTVVLGEGMDYMDKKTSVPLALRDKGAFLVMAKGDELNRSSMILRSDLGLDVQEEPVSGRVRANVYRRASKLYLAKAEVKVIGEGNADFISGQTDLRGVFVAENI
ncbi:tetratricopeptide repeat protein, partial [Candidatus Sumerlaeota bacterium]|nr:tetratricopeptide repeat protein [Candidatus Sumerlaeota bacterium]